MEDWINCNARISCRPNVLYLLQKNDTVEVQPLDGTLLCYIPFLSFQYVLVTTPFASTQACIKSQVCKEAYVLCYRCDQVTKNQRGREVNVV